MKRLLSLFKKTKITLTKNEKAEITYILQQNLKKSDLRADKALKGFLNAKKTLDQIPTKD